MEKGEGVAHVAKKSGNREMEKIPAGEAAREASRGVVRVKYDLSSPEGRQVRAGIPGHATCRGATAGRATIVNEKKDISSRVREKQRTTRKKELSPSNST
ncbi:MAG: hypothetical protein LBF09_03735 [Odoribacteraceae bacterium]|jgi:hypothetical protein|nr:hypothetical protein [Odoribacteraceae bacterium]